MRNDGGAQTLAGSSRLTEGTSFRRCVDFAVKIRVNPQQTGIDTNVKHSMVRPPIFYIFTFLESTHMPLLPRFHILHHQKEPIR